LARGYAHLAGHQFAEARQDFLKVIELAPKNFDAYHQLARIEHHQGDSSSSIEYFRKAMELNPDDYESPLIAIGSYQQAGDEGSMRHYARIGIERARQHLEDYPDNPRPYYLGTSAFLILGEPEEARKWAEAALAMAPDDSTTRYNLACYYALIGETDTSLDLLESSIHSRSWIEGDHELDSLRDHPRYKAYIDSLPE
jgi:adenylate cyclase